MEPLGHKISFTPWTRGEHLRHSFKSLIPRQISHEGMVLEQHIREGKFQRTLALVAAFASLMSGLEVSYEHYRGSYSQQVMWTPVALSLGLAIAGAATSISRRAARILLPLFSVLSLIDGVVGFYFHVRGVARKPGGWRVPTMNVIMGPPVFAPLLFGLSGYLGLIASLLRREDDPSNATPPGLPRPPHGFLQFIPRDISHEGIVLEHHIREGRFQKHLAVAAGVSAMFSGAEALYSHYENGFKYQKLQWSPIVISPMLLVAGIATVPSKVVGRTLLPLVSACAVIDGAIGFYFHARGVLRRPGGLKVPVYNIIYGPPIFAPLLLSASGMMGLLASLLRRGD
jgi:hypothetical protein